MLVTITKPFVIELLLKERVRLVLLAVSSKLLRQYFAIAKAGILYDGNHVLVLKTR